MVADGSAVVDVRPGEAWLVVREAPVTADDDRDKVDDSAELEPGGALDEAIWAEVLRVVVRGLFD